MHFTIMQPNREGTHTFSDKVSIYKTGFSQSTAELWNICMLKVAKGSKFKTVQLSASHHFLCFTMSNHHEDSGGFHCILHSLQICVHTESHFGILTHFVIQSALHMGECLCIHTEVNISCEHSYFNLPLQCVYMFHSHIPVFCHPDLSSSLPLCIELTVHYLLSYVPLPTSKS